MRKHFLFLAVLLVVMSALTGCRFENNTPTVLSGFYLTQPDDASLASAYIALDSEKSEFTFGASMFMSYAEYGTYTIDKDKLIAVSQNATYTFTIKDEKTLVLIDKGTDNYFSFPVETQFVFNEELGQ